MVLILLSNQMIAQEGSLQNLVGGKASSTEMDLESRGYRLISTKKDNYASYTTWWSDDKNKCISVKTADGRTAVFTPTIRKRHRLQQYFTLHRRDRHMRVPAYDM